MAVTASGQGGLLVRVDPKESARLLRTTKAEAMVMRSKAMAGWLLVGKEHVRTKRQLAPWVVRGTAHARAPARK
jgi:hypothetical protein